MNDEKLKKEFGDRVRQLRLQKGWTLQELAEKCGYTSRASINKIENGTIDVSQTKARTIAEALGVSVQYLLGINEYYNNPETAEIAQKIYEGKELRALFDAAADSSPEDLQTVYAMLLALKRKEDHFIGL